MINKVLEIKNLTKIYKMYKNNFDRLKEIFVSKNYHKEFVSNKNITFDLFEGETLGIIGVNGAGKSTLLKQIAGVIEPSSGTITRHGRVTALLELGTGFNDELSGYENIFLNGTLIGMTQKECESHKQNIIEFSELGEYIYEPIKTYSSGMKMRLAFSIAIFSSPKILIVDEALSVGDAHFSAKCTKALKERKEQNMSIIYVSHDLNSLKLLCDRVILLNCGQLEKEGTPEQVINHYNFLIAKLNETNQLTLNTASSKSSFGTFDIEITNIFLKKNNHQISNTFITGETISIEIEFSSKIDTEDITIGIMIRDKFAQDIYGTNTYYQNKQITITKSKSYLCTYQFPLNLGIGKYFLTVALHTAHSHIENCYHWIDNGATFEVLGAKDQFFNGLCRLEPTIQFDERGNINI